MSLLVASLSSGKGTWIPVLDTIKGADWKRIFIITTPYFVDKLPSFEGKEVRVVVVDDNKPVQEMAADIAKQLDFSFAGDVGVNLISGSGKEHMAILAAVLKTGSGIRLVAAQSGLGIVEL